MSVQSPIPGRILKRMMRLCAELEELQEEIEDLLIANNPRLLSELRKSRREHLAGRTRPYDEAARSVELAR